MANAFRLLLSKISSRLNGREIRSLVLICEIPESLQSEMKDGISLFDNLIKRDVISENELGKLKDLMKNLDPQRQDLIGLIENFENGSSSQTNRLGRSSSAGAESLQAYADRRGDTPKSTETVCCTIKCPCMTLECREFSFKITWSYVVLTTLFSICFLIVALFWYADVPKITESIASHEHLKEAGPYILIAIGVIYVLCLSSMCYWRKRRKIINRIQPYPSIQPSA